MSTSVILYTSEVSISDTCQADISESNLFIYFCFFYISLLDVPDQKSTLCQADNTSSDLNNSCAQ